MNTYRASEPRDREAKVAMPSSVWIPYTVLETLPITPHQIWFRLNDADWPANTHHIKSANQARGLYLQRDLLESFDELV